VKPLVIIPTYNEADNVRDLVPEIRRLAPTSDILVVDDHSPDGTADAVATLQEAYPGKVHLLERDGAPGLGKAYVAGFRHGLAGDHDRFVQMDADFSHRPRDLVKLLEASSPGNIDFVVGSRWVEGGGTLNWGRGRRVLSRGGSVYSRWVLGYPLGDWTGGFNLWKRRALEMLDLDSITSEGYSFQIELKYRALRQSLVPAEVPITFMERRVGESKMSTRIVVEALYRVWMIRNWRAEPRRY